MLAAFALLAASALPQNAPPETLVRAAARPITGSDADYSDLVAAAGATRRVMMGESTHGTHEYYRERGRITERLIRDFGFNAVAIEGDWSATSRVNRYVRGLGSDRSAAEALGGYRSFPRWMWANRDFAEFIERLRALNLTRPPEQRVGVYGMDVYDLFDAADAVVAYLQLAGPAAGQRARRHYRCFARYDRSTQAYAIAVRRPSRSCQPAAEAVLAEVRQMPRPSAPEAAERHFAAVRSAASVAAAEAYFRTVAIGSLAWNVRDEHMAGNVEDIAAHAEALSGRPGKVVIWSHNSHTGDARATAAANRGELNLGQLMRQRHGEAAFLIGFFSHSGTLRAAPEWGASGRVYRIRPALPGSHAALFQETGLPAFSLLLRGQAGLAERFGESMLQRAIGVVYRPDTERESHYFGARLSRQFDAVVFFDQSIAVTPL
ncbi:MAG TPA: erythromycin esterase family protein [Allosphingosinicella sp.]